VGALRVSFTLAALQCSHRHQRPRHHGDARRSGYRNWRTTQSKTLPAAGRYHFGLRPRATGTSWWRVYKASDPDHIGAISRSFRLVVYRAAITGIHADAAGDDRRNRNGEYALVRNTGGAAINLAGWKLDAGDRIHQLRHLRWTRVWGNRRCRRSNVSATVPTPPPRGRYQYREPLTSCCEAARG
jgi:hypothetical protein